MSFVSLSCVLFCQASDVMAVENLTEKESSIEEAYQKSTETNFIVDTQGKHRPLGVYQHYKGNRYNVLGVCRHTETQEQLVLYQSMYGKFELWVRPVAMFFEEIEWEGKKQERFKFIKNLSTQIRD